MYHCKIENVESQGLKFHDYENLETAIELVLCEIEKVYEHVLDEHVVVEVTGGSKLTSVVGAAVTFRRQTSFQYVDTTDGNRVHLYDVAFETRPEV